MGKIKISEGITSEKIQGGCLMKRQNGKTLLKAIGVGVLVLIVVLLTLAGLNEKPNNVQEGEATYQYAEIITNDAHYQLFKTKDVQEYLNFLESFDETKYEIVDISTSMKIGTSVSGEFYMVTYKTIAE